MLFLVVVPESEGILLAAVHGFHDVFVGVFKAIDHLEKTSYDNALVDSSVIYIVGDAVTELAVAGVDDEGSEQVLVVHVIDDLVHLVKVGFRDLHREVPERVSGLGARVPGFRTGHVLPGRKTHGSHDHH